VFQSLCRDSWWSNMLLLAISITSLWSFNPFVGILGGQTQVPTKLTVIEYSFNPFVGILGGQTGDVPHLDGFQLDCFNPFVGILGGQTPHQCRRPLGGCDCFNPFVGILGGQTTLRDRVELILVEFQSLCRDSWWSNPARRPATVMITTCFNPFVGILGGQTFQFESWVVGGEAVSIPLSGFLVVKRTIARETMGYYAGFNPFVGILGGQT